MEILLLLISLSVVLVFLIGAAFWWSVRSGQFDDLEGPAHRILADDDTPRQPPAGSAHPDEARQSGRHLTSIKPDQEAGS